ncbi:hypothetical protein CTAM01_06794, partial [Colletotrichum tamarilloi]
APTPTPTPTPTIPNFILWARCFSSSGPGLHVADHFALDATQDIYIASSIPGHQRFCIIIDSFCQSLPHTILYRLWHGLPCFGLSPDTTLKILHRVSLPAFHHKCSC